MRIVFLLESAAQLWGGVKVVLDDANRLTDRGHEVFVLSKSGPPAWAALRCDYRTVTTFEPHEIPAADLIVGTYWSTVPFAVRSGKGTPVHLCQGYEGDAAANAELRARIESVYRLGEARKITIAPHLQRLLKERFDQDARLLRYVVDHDVMFPADPPRSCHERPVRVGVVGPYEIPWKDVRTGLDACALAYRAGLDLCLVRVTNTEPHAAETDLPIPVEWHRQVRPDKMGDLYRSLDVFLGTSSGPEEGFFLPAVEAMACGVPCILTEIPCFREYASNEPPYALFVEPRDPAGMAEAMVLAAIHPDVHDQLRATGLEVAARYNAVDHVDDLERAFADILSRSLPPSGHRSQAPVRRPSLSSSSPPASSPPSSLVPPPVPLRQPSPSPSRSEPNAEAGTAMGPARTGTTATATATARRTAAAASSDSLTALSDGIHASLQQIAELYRSAERYADAASHLEAALCIRPDDPALMQALGNARYLAGDDDGALRAFERTLQTAGDDAGLHADRGMILFGQRRVGEAAQSFAAAIRCGGRTAENFNNLGVALYQSGDVAGATAAFREALDLEPGHADASANLRDVTAHPAPPAGPAQPCATANSR